MDKARDIEAILKVVKDEPGCLSKRVAELTGMKLDLVAFYLGLLQGRKQIKSEDWSGINDEGQVASRYYLRDYEIPEKPLDTRWREAIAEIMGWDVPEGTPEQVIAGLVAEMGWAWRDEVAKYIPHISIMSFIGPQSTIRWVFDCVDLKPEHKEMADKYFASMQRVKEQGDGESVPG